VIFGKLDRLIPWQQAEWLAAEAPQAELVMYPDGNHVCNNTTMAHLAAVFGRCSL